MKRDFDPSKVKKISIDKVRPNTWNPKEKDTIQYEKVKQSVKEKGLMGTIAVRQSKDGYEILDGEQRWTSAKELGYKEVYIYDEGKVDDIEAKALTIWWQQQVPFKQQLEYVLVSELIEQDENIALPYTSEELEDMAHIDIDLNEYFEQVNQDQAPDGMKTLKVVLGEEAYNVVMQAIAKVQAENDNISEARAVELICADFLGK